jgi:hypothetical protein
LSEIKKLKDLDTEVRASGFNHFKDMDYISEILNIREQTEAEEKMRDEDYEGEFEEDDDVEQYLLQEGVQTEPKLIFEEEEHQEEEDEQEEEEMMKKEEVKPKKVKMKEDKYIKKAIKSKFKRKKKIPYNRNRNKAKGKLLKSLGLK